MSVVSRSRILVAICSTVAVHGAHAQISTTASAPVPSVISSAQRVFISNAGGDSYESTSYYPLGVYTGGPNRFYNQFYAAMKDWGRFTLTDSPAGAEVVYEVRFTSPAVDQRRHDTGNFVYDPQLNLNLLDPQTRVVLWSLTEHIAPARTASGANSNFDKAVGRLVMRVKALVSGDMASLAIAEETPSPELISVARHAAHLRHSAIGLAVGGAIGTFMGRVHVPTDCTTPTTCNGEWTRSNRRFVTYAVGGGAIGALIGWLWPTS